MVGDGALRTSTSSRDTVGALPGRRRRLRVEVEGEAADRSWRADEGSAGQRGPRAEKVSEGQPQGGAGVHVPEDAGEIGGLVGHGLRRL